MKNITKKLAQLQKINPSWRQDGAELVLPVCDGTVRIFQDGVYVVMNGGENCPKFGQHYKTWSATLQALSD